MLPDNSQFPNPNPPRPPGAPAPVGTINPVNPNMPLKPPMTRPTRPVNKIRDNLQKNGTGTTTPNKPPVSPPRTKGGTGTSPKPGSDKVTLPMRPGYKPEYSTLPYNKNNSKKLGRGF